MNIKEISNQSGLPYSTARKYLVLLEESGLLSSRLEEGSRVFDNQSVRYVKGYVKTPQIEGVGGGQTCNRL